MGEDEGGGGTRNSDVGRVTSLTIDSLAAAHPRIKCGAGSELVEGNERQQLGLADSPLKWFDRLTMSGLAFAQFSYT